MIIDRSFEITFFLGQLRDRENKYNLHSKVHYQKVIDESLGKKKVIDESLGKKTSYV